MNHRKIEEAAALYALGALEEMERTQVELHLDTCSACRALVQLEMDTIGAMARETPEAAPPETLRARVLETAARTGQPRPKGERRWRRGWAWLSLTPAPRAAAMFGGAAVLLLAVLLGLVISQQGNLSGLRSDNDRLTVLLENQQQQLQGQQGLLRDQVGANDRIADMVAEQQAVLADQQTMSYLLAVPGLVKYGLRASPEAAPARGLLVTNASKTWGMVMLLEMPQLQPGTAYAIWLNGGGPIGASGRGAGDSGEHRVRTALHQLVPPAAEQLRECLRDGGAFQQRRTDWACAAERIAVLGAGGGYARCASTRALSVSASICWVLRIIPAMPGMSFMSQGRR